MPFRHSKRQMIELPFDIIDHIFSFLKSHPKALIACSKAHPVFSQIAERHRYHHIIIRTGLATDFTHSFQPSDLHQQLTSTPRIVKYTAIMQIEFKYRTSKQTRSPYLEEIALLLPMFPALKCIMLSTTKNIAATLSWQEDLPLNFRKAVENCLYLRTLQEIHIGNMAFPLSVLDNHPNINRLSLYGPPWAGPEYRKAAYPHIKSLALERFGQSDGMDFLNWAKQHIVGLESLKSCHERILKVVELCPNTLENLYLCLHRQKYPHTLQLLGLLPGPINLSSLPRLRHLTIHTEIFFHFLFWGEILATSYLPQAVKIIETASSLQQLNIEIYVDPCLAILDRVDLSPLLTLESPLRFPHIDLYIYTGSPRLRITHSIMGSFLAKHQGLLELIKQGVLAVHPEESAPTLP